LAQSVEGKLLISTSINQSCLMTHDEGMTIKKLEDIIRQG